MNNLSKLFLSFVKAGTISYGGGNSQVPIIQREVVDKYNLVTEEEFDLAFGFGSALPSSIATKVATSIGYQVAGIPGAIVSVIGMLLPSTIGCFFIVMLYSYFQEQDWMDGVVKAINPVVIVIIGSVPYRMFKKTYREHNLFNTISVICISALALVTVVMGISPVVIIVVAILYGMFFIKSDVEITP